MKVFQINICPDLSTGSLMTKIAHELEDRGDIAITAAAPKNNTAVYKNHYVIGSMFERHVNIAIGQLLGKESSASCFSTVQLINAIKLERPDIIHLHNIHQYYLNYRMLFKFLIKINIPVVWTLHDCWGFTGICHHYVEEKCNKWKSECNDCTYIKHQKYALLDLSRAEFHKKKKYYSMMKRLYIVTPSKWLAEETRSSILADKKICTISNGIDTNQFIYRENDIRKLYKLEDKFIILGVASHWSKNKGLNDFIKLSDILGNRYQIVIIGIDVNVNTVRRENILYLNRTSDVDTLTKWYSAADVYCSLSTEESFGLVVVEAMSCGTPVIVYNSTASPEIIEGTDCFVCSPHDIFSVKKAIEEIKSNGKKKYSTSCRKKVISEYDIKVTVNRYVELYKRIFNDGDINND